MMVLIAHQAPQRLRIDVPSFVTSQDLIPQPTGIRGFSRRIDDALTLEDGDGIGITGHVGTFCHVFNAMIDQILRILPVDFVWVAQGRRYRL